MDDEERLKELHKQRERLELAQLQADSGLISRKEVTLTVESLEWMYDDNKDRRAAADFEAYRLGKPLDGVAASAEVQHLKGEGDAKQEGGTAGALFLRSVTKTDSDTLRKIREDPLFAIQQAEAKQRAEIDRVAKTARMARQQAEQTKRRDAPPLRPPPPRGRGRSSSSGSESSDDGGRRQVQTVADRRRWRPEGPPRRSRSPPRRPRERWYGRPERRAPRREDRRSLERTRPSSPPPGRKFENGGEGAAGGGSGQRRLGAAKPADFSEQTRRFEEATLGPPPVMLKRAAKAKAAEDPKGTRQVGENEFRTRSYGEMLEAGKRHVVERDQKLSEVADKERRNEAFEAISRKLKEKAEEASKPKL